MEKIKCEFTKEELALIFHCLISTGSAPKRFSDFVDRFWQALQSHGIELKDYDFCRYE